MSSEGHFVPDGAQLRKRKIRKGTTSCWECKKRKVKCHFTSSNGSICSGCTRRGTPCLTQEYDDISENHSDRRPRKSPDRRSRGSSEIARQYSNPYNPYIVRQGPSSSSDESDDAKTPASVQIFDSTLVDLNRALDDYSPSSFPTLGAHSDISRALQAALPSQHDANLIISTGYTPYYLQFFTLPYKDLFNGRMKCSSSLSAFPAPQSHPILFARMLLYIAHGILCLHPTRLDSTQLNIASLSKARRKYMDLVSNLVTNNDHFLNTLEGLECLILEGTYNVNTGNLRRAWQVLRRAIAQAQLMGLHSGESNSIPRLDPSSLSSPSFMWYRIVHQDRYLSLLLDLPPGCVENAISPVEGDAEKGSMMDSFEQKTVHLMGQVLIRNSMMNGTGAHSMTSSIDEAFSRLATEGNSDWWLAPMSKCQTPDNEEKLDDVLRILSHISHFQLLILLHLPYMLRGRYEYSKTTCTSASRELLNRYVRFRDMTAGVFSCRSIDFSAFTSCIVLLLIHVDHATQIPQGGTFASHQRPTDLALVKEIIAIITELDEASDDSLLQHIANILSCLCNIEARALSCRAQPNHDLEYTSEGSDSHHGLKLSIPYVGRISITSNGIFNELGVRITTIQQPQDLASTMPPETMVVWDQGTDMGNPGMQTDFFSSQHIPVMNPLPSWNIENADTSALHDFIWMKE